MWTPPRLTRIVRIFKDEAAGQIVRIFKDEVVSAVGDDTGHVEETRAYVAAYSGPLVEVENAAAGTLKTGRLVVVVSIQLRGQEVNACVVGSLVGPMTADGAEDLGELTLLVNLSKRLVGDLDTGSVTLHVTVFATNQPVNSVTVVQKGLNTYFS